MLVNSSLSEVGDAELLFPGDRFPVVAGPVLRSSGWRGGLFVQYATGTNPFTVEVSDGSSVAGFMLFQSEFYSALQPGSFGAGGAPLVGSPQNFLSQQSRSPIGANNVVTMVSGGTRVFFKAFETVSLVGLGTRTGANITYVLTEQVKVSENGLLCNDSDANLVAAGVATPTVVGIVSAIPTAANGNRLCIDLKY